MISAVFIATDSTGEVLYVYTSTDVEKIPMIDVAEETMARGNKRGIVHNVTLWSFRDGSIVEAWQVVREPALKPRELPAREPQLASIQCGVDPTQGADPLQGWKPRCGCEGRY